MFGMSNFGISNLGISNLGISNLGISNFGISKADARVATAFGLAVFGDSLMTVSLAQRADSGTQRAVALRVHRLALISNPPHVAPKSWRLGECFNLI
jgi:hypothetical protein